MFGCFQEAPWPKDSKMCCQNVTALIAASLSFIPIFFPSYSRTQSQKCLWLHTGNQTTAWWLWPIFLSQHMSAWQHCLQSPGVLQLGSEQGCLTWTLRMAFPASSVSPKQDLNTSCCGFNLFSYFLVLSSDSGKAALLQEKREILHVTRASKNEGETYCNTRSDVFGVKFSWMVEKSDIYIYWLN